jgi:hypothetical protein
MVDCNIGHSLDERERFDEHRLFASYLALSLQIHKVKHSN